MEVGQIIYVKWPHYNNSELTETKVSKVGRKYFYIEEYRYRDCKFDKESLVEVSDYGAKAKVYLSKDGYEKEQKKAENCRYISSKFNYGNNTISFEASERIVEILKEFYND